MRVCLCVSVSIATHLKMKRSELARRNWDLVGSKVHRRLSQGELLLCSLSLLALQATAAEGWAVRSETCRLGHICVNALASH